MSGELEPLSIFVIGAALLALPLAVLVVWLGRRLRAAKAELKHQAEEAEKSRDILAAAPDGLFVWDHGTGRELCSRRLAVLLGLTDGTESTYYDIRGTFEGEASASFDKAVGALRRDGIAFDLVLPVNERLLHVIGLRTGTPDGKPIADLLWMRDADETHGATTPPPSQSDALTAAYDSFQYLLDALPIPIWLRDADLAVAFTNKASRGEALAGLSGALAAKARGAGDALSENHAIATDGRDQAFQITETPVKGWVGTAGFAIPEVTAPVQGIAPEASLVANLDRAVAVYGPDQRIRTFNAAYATLWKLDQSWLDLGPSLSEILDRKRELRRLPEVADFKAFKDEQLALFSSPDKHGRRDLHLPDGSTIRSIVTSDGSGGLVFEDEDVTDRLNLQRDVHTLDAVQRETIDNLHEGIAVFGSDGRLKLTNPRLFELWGLEAGALADGIHVSAFVDALKPKLPPVEDWEPHRDGVAARLMSREPATGRIVRPDGSVLTYANVPLPDGAVLAGYLDISDSAKVEAALRERATALDEAGKLKSAFIANVSHEIRVPMNTVIGFAETLTNEYFGPLNKRQKEYGQGILDASQGLMQVIGDILDLASIEAGMMSLELDTVDVNAMLVGVLGLIRERARRKGLTVEFDCPADIGWMVADERRLKQVLLNLLSNAVQFTPDRGTILLSAKREDEDVLFKVSDTGIGIPQGDQERVFGTFERNPSPETGQLGAGLGLSIVKQFVELHGGIVDIKSTPNKGTTVTCRLPSGGLVGNDPIFPTPGIPH